MNKKAKVDKYSENIITIENKNDSFLKNIKKEWVSGWAKLIGWTIPLLIVSIIVSNTFNNKLNINSFEIIASKNDYVHDGQELEKKGYSTVAKEIEFDQNGSIIPKDYYSMTHEIEIKGQGKIANAFMAYSPDDTGEFVITPVDVRKEFLSLFKRIFSVSPSTISARITTQSKKSESDNFEDKKIRRAYIFFKDTETSSFESALILFDIADTSSKPRIINMKEVLSITPSDPKSDELYLSMNNTEIKKEYYYIIDNNKFLLSN